MRAKCFTSTTQKFSRNSFDSVYWAKYSFKNSQKKYGE